MNCERSCEPDTRTVHVRYEYGDCHNGVCDYSGTRCEAFREAARLGLGAYVHDRMAHVGHVNLWTLRIGDHWWQDAWCVAGVRSAVTP